MAKIHLLVCGLLWAFLFPGTPCRADVNIREKVQQIYTSQIGVKEKTGHNDGKEVRKYLATCKLPEGYEYCSAFVTWTFNSAGINSIRTAWAASWYAEKRLVYKQGWNAPKAMPQPGDLVLYYSPAKKRICHVGFFDKYGDKYCETVEANTGIAGVQGVHRLKRYLKSFYAIVNRID